MMKSLFSLLLICTIPSVVLGEDSSLVVNWETGAIWQHRNDVRIQPDTGTYLEADQFDQGAFLHYRVDARYHLGGRHFLRLVLAPNNISVTGQSQAPVIFDGVTFNANQDLTIDYQFNSWRLGYTYRVSEGGSYYFDIGATAKIRQAEIKLTQGNLSQAYDNVGFVPLFYFAFQQNFGQGWHLYTDCDFAAAPQGRAIDFNIKLRKALAEDTFLGFGYRTIEGGADNEEVFTFSWFNYAVIDLSTRF